MHGVRLPQPWKNSDGRYVNLVLHDRRQMPVGQGGFHVGSLRHVKGGEYRHPPFDDSARFKGAEFLYVYDCGSSPKTEVEREIKDLISHRSERHLNILFLSHFDLDHICGTPMLLGARRKRLPGFTVDTIVLPYVDHVERLISFARATSISLERGRSVPDFFRRMIINPVAALSEFDPRQIIFVEGDEPPSDGDAGTMPDPDLGPWSGSGPETRLEIGFGFRIEASYTVSDSDPARSALRPEVRIRRLGGGQGSAAVSSLLARDFAFRVHDWGGVLGWRLTPHVRSAPKAAIEAFERAAEVELKWAAGSFRSKIAVSSVRLETVTKHRMKLARAYGAIFGKSNKNLTSMSLYSGPANPEEADGWTITPVLLPHLETKIGWMGTGDTPLKDVHDISTFERFYSNDMKRITTFMFPHHGSIENSEPGQLVSQADTFVAAADPSHDWEHPSKQLCKAASLTGAAVEVVMKQRKTAFDESVLVTWGDDRDELEKLFSAGPGPNSEGAKTFAGIEGIENAALVR
ncbi:hypothetical protein [Agrobacterium sp. DSM 25558]|uniref:hypothetical protein n=1 Tax=Agrobacterium sp. DSM 25558 TaxID=1907665 RepID=UPI0011777E31|nr:hypothetical protein [Agrobacterium sp. DSM 25558]